MLRNTRRFHPALVLATTVLTLPATAGATERFASSDETRLTQDCLTAETACALGRALDASPASTAIGDEILTLLAGTYDAADIAAGDPTPTGGVELPAGLTLQGDPSGPAPLITVADPRPEVTGVNAEYGGVVRHLEVSRTGAPLSVGVWLSGPGGLGPFKSFGPGERPRAASTLPFLADHVVVTSDVSTKAMQVDGTGTVINSLVQQRGDAVGGGSGLNAVTKGGTIELIGNTITNEGESAALVAHGVGSINNRVVITNTLAYGAHHDFFSDSINGTGADTGSALTVEIANSAMRRLNSDLHPSSTVVGFTDPGLGLDLVPAPSSPLVDAGKKDPRLGTKDLAGRARVFGTGPDIGAFEAQTPKVAPTGQADRTSPAVTLKGLGKKVTLVKLIAGLRVEIGSNERATLSAKLTTDVRKGQGKRRKTVARTLATADGTATGDGPVTLSLVPAKRKVPGGIKQVTVTVVVTDDAGNRSVVARTLKIGR